MSRTKAVIAGIAGAALLAALSGCTGHEAVAAAHGRLVRVAVEPAYSLPTMNRKYRPLLKLLEERTGYRIETVSALSYGNYLSTLEGAQVDIGFMNGFAFLAAQKTRGAYPLARILDLDGQAEQRGVIVVRRDSAIRSCSDLRGRTIATLSRRAPASYLSPRAKCVAQGFDPERDAMVLSVGTLDEGIRRVLEGDVAAAMVREEAARELGVAQGKLRVLVEGEPVPTWCFAAFRSTNPRVARRFREALLALNHTNPEDADALKLAGIGGFVPANPGDYAVVERLANRLHVPY